MKVAYSVGMTKTDGRKLDHATLEELRIRAVKSVVEKGHKPSEVMRTMGLCRTTIYGWLETYLKGGWEALAGSKAKGPEPKLTEKQRQLVARWILGKDPRQYGFDFGLWTREIVRQLILEKMGVDLCLASVGNLLASLNITPQKPLRRAYERDPKAIQFWLDTTYPALKKRAQTLGADIFFLDEAGFQSDPSLGRTYGLKGKTPVVRTSGRRQSINVISAVNARGAFWAVTYDGKLNAETFALFLEDFMKGRERKVFLVIDGHPAHTAKAAQRYAESLGGRLELHRLPTYAPDLNPDEFVWSHMKTNGVSKKPLRKDESLRDRVEEDLMRIQADIKLVCSFFRAPSVAYAID